ncbi:HIT family protein [Streptomonospora litoralis]|uniref:HIT domain protein n=1 Tax=Streptomonospora litoralis TaxID=2498135 RepID=A0A4P6Q424_9ACTN|nr:HIT domain-containing protein [Streptomonospora litoralis]QBI53457.1 HIT domain protein [Streptomonospora litoralis]
MRDPSCVFCRIVDGDAPATVVDSWPEALAITPLNPVVPGHTLVIPRRHVAHAVADPEITAHVMRRAAQLADAWASTNILTSIGAAATQSVYHLHIHVVPRTDGDGLMLPWGTTGDPHAPHRCDRVDELEARLTALHDVTARAADDIITHTRSIPTEQIRTALGATDHAQHLTRRAVAHARHHGWTWEQIGSELGITRQAAWERWRHTTDEQEDSTHA